MPRGRSASKIAACALCLWFAPGSVQGQDPGGTLFVNFDGAVIGGGPDDATTNSSELAEQFGFTGEYPEWGGSEAQRAAVMTAAGADWAPFDVALVEVRPTDGDYAMTMVGPADHPFGMGTNSTGPIDCMDSNPRNIAFVFFGADDLGGSASVGVQATEISQEFAHGFGLEHVSGSEAQVDIMFPSNESLNAAFVDDCFPLSGMVQCGEQHEMLSGCEAGEQNSYAELIGLFGAAKADTEAPTVELVAPEDGEVFAIEQDIQIRVEAADDVGVDRVELILDQGGGFTGTQAPYEWTLMGLSEGAHELFAIAADEAGNETQSAVITIFVEAPDDTEGGTESGCGCRTTRSGLPNAILLTLLIPLIRRRRIALRTIA